MRIPTPAPDRTAVVTGASSGIGAEIARELARRGHGLVLVARRADRLEELARSLRSPQVRVEVLAGDLADRGFRASLADRVDALGLVPNILVNDAGFGTTGPVSTADPEVEVSMLEVDLVTVADLCTRFLPGMVARGRGVLLNVASTAAFQPMPGQAAYAAAKSFVLSYSQALSAELRGTGVSVTALCPGAVRTEFASTAGLTEEEFASALPSFLIVPAREVARAGVDGADKGHPVVIPGPANQLTAILGHLAPRRLLLPILASRHPALHKHDSAAPTAGPERTCRPMPSPPPHPRSPPTPRRSRPGPCS